ncbi:MAG: DUF805 domain-containing protein [Gemmatimonadetes bacterium]|nr:DUF805 domain-containing protein [Gemmatimonadota bacterium]GIS80976.1 MAG: hypothetical protein CM1200mP14_25420 [Gammaproteobacteria bacterium]
MSKLWWSTAGRIPVVIFWTRFLIPAALILGVARIVSGGGLLFTCAFILLIWPFTVGAVKRLHDLNLPGWIGFVLWTVGPSLQVLWALFASTSEPTVVFRGWSEVPIYSEDLAFGVGAVWFFLFVFTTVFISLSPGRKGSNKYGPNPLG